MFIKGLCSNPDLVIWAPKFVKSQSQFLFLRWQHILKIIYIFKLRLLSTILQIQDICLPLRWLLELTNYYNIIKPKLTESSTKLGLTIPSFSWTALLCLEKAHLWIMPTHMKNWEPLVCFPRFAIDKRNALSCLRIKFSSVWRKHKFVSLQL